MFIYVCIVSGCFCIITTEFSSCNKDYMAYKLKIFITWPYAEKFAYLWYRKENHT